MDKLNELRLGLTSALLAAGDIATAKEELSALEEAGATSGETRLRRALVSFLERDREKLETLMHGLEVDDVGDEKSLGSFS